jgi:hypothetical protein
MCGSIGRRSDASVTAAPRPPVGARRRGWRAMTMGQTRGRPRCHCEGRVRTARLLPANSPTHAAHRCCDDGREIIEAPRFEDFELEERRCRGECVPGWRRGDDERGLASSRAARRSDGSTTDRYGAPRSRERAYARVRNEGHSGAPCTSGSTPPETQQHGDDDYCVAKGRRSAASRRVLRGFVRTLCRLLARSRLQHPLERRPTL